METRKKNELHLQPGSKSRRKEKTTEATVTKLWVPPIIRSETGILLLAKKKQTAELCLMPYKPKSQPLII